MAVTTDNQKAKEPDGAQAASSGMPSISYSHESERLLLATVLTEGRKEVAENLLLDVSPNDFYIDEHAAIWRSVQSLHNNGLGHDAVAIIDHARATKSFIGGTDAVFGLVEDMTLTVASEEAIKAAAKRIKEFSIQRKLKQIFQTGMTLCDTPGQNFTQILSMVEDDLLNLRKSSESGREGPVHIREGVLCVLDRLQRQADGEQIGIGVTTGIQKLDEITSGFIDEDFIIVAARPSMGKTALLLNLAAAGAKAGRNALIFSLEMKGDALAQRLLGREGRVPLSQLRSGEIPEDSWERVFDGARQLEDMPIWIDDTPGLTIHEIRSRARAFCTKHGKATIYVDYIQHVAKRDTGAKGQQEDRGHVSEVSSGLKGMARELKCPVVGLSQLNRSLEQRANKTPMMSDLRESGSLEQDADVILFVYRDVVYNPETPNPDQADIIVAKQRDGAVGVVPTLFTKEIGAFHDFIY